MGRITLLAGLVLSLSATAMAQQSADKTAPRDDKKITVTGCLQSGAQANQFVLTTAGDPLSKGVTVATSGTVPNVTYQLSGGSNLAAHLNHRVEITGTSSGKSQKAVATETSVSRTEIPNKPDPKVETKERAAVELRDLHIESMKMVSNSCK